jgi:Calcineurin-like phosphoesterase
MAWWWRSWVWSSGWDAAWIRWVLLLTCLGALLAFISARVGVQADTTDDATTSQNIIEKLSTRRLPQMVDWLSPSVLAKVGIRQVISQAIGSYADQRPMQAAADHAADEDALWQRHDYRQVYPHAPNAGLGEDGRWKLNPAKEGDSVKSLKFDADGALWVDFIADLGDGFEATYAMAYLLAKSRLFVADMPANEAPNGLPAGDILIFGGDLAYPDATVEGYNDRCITPYNAAFQMKEKQEPQRKLFFISGNHDWYDGLAAFTSVFCAARDRFSMGRGKKIGGWQCEQRRSYFALGLPGLKPNAAGDWWIWGIDHALNDSIDDAQKDYFELMSRQTKRGDKVIIILHAPVWQQDRDCAHLHMISELARNYGAEVVAVIAGDLHFYSRYHTQTPKLDLQVIVSGGGGAFAHPTHQEPLSRKVPWTLPKAPAPLPHTERDFQKEMVPTTARDEPALTTLRRAFEDPEHLDFHTREHFYPSRLKSRMLSLRNLWLPFHNRGMAMCIGAVYFLYAWMFQVSVADPLIAIRNAQVVQVNRECSLLNEPDVLKCKETGKKYVEKVVDDLFKDRTKIYDDKLKRGIEKYWQSLQTEWSKGVVALAWKVVSDGPETFFAYIKPGIAPDRILTAMLANPFFFMMMAGLWVGLVYFVGYVGVKSYVLMLLLGTLHFFTHLAVLLTTDAVISVPYNLAIKQGGLFWPVLGAGTVTVLWLMVGGLIGSAVFGLYSTTMSFLGLETKDQLSFSALGVKDYKNFLRMRFDPNGGLTIYAIGLDKVPGRKGWRAIDPKKDQAVCDDHNPLIVPKTDMKPRLIDRVEGQTEGNRWSWRMPV